MLSLIATCANDKCVVYRVISVIKFTQALWSCSGWRGGKPSKWLEKISVIYSFVAELEAK